MLISTRNRRIIRRPDWYSAKGRVHVDRRLSKADALRLVSNPATVAQHDFLPLISFTKRERRYRREAGKKKPVASTKERGLAYPSNRDGYIFAYYAERLGSLYEVELALRGLSDCVIGYRKGSSNIDRALEAFREIQARGDCAAVCLDIKGFFDNISHEVLKACWSSLLGGGQLPDDHYKVFRALTKYATMDRADLLVRLGLSPKKRDADLQRPLCSIDEYRRLRSDRAAPSKLVSTSRENHGIPQGTPLSAAAANISMLEFDTAVKAAVDACGGSYRRYSDDILILCAPEHIAALEGEVNRALKLHGKTLWLNEKKREEARFSTPGPALLPCPVTGRVKSLQYLGFTFDGCRALIRSGTLGRYYRRMRNGVRVAKWRSRLAKQGEIKGRKVLHRREILARHSHLGPRSFVSGYVRLARKKMGDVGEPSIRRQLSRHLEVLKKQFKK